jgi:hypothetical protein
VHLGNWVLTAFVDNLSNSHTILNYQMSQADTYVTGITPPTVQQNQFTFRPRTFGLNAVWKVGH